MLPFNCSHEDIIQYINILEAKIDLIIELSKSNALPQGEENEIAESSTMKPINNFKLPSQRRAEYQRKLDEAAHVQKVEDGEPITGTDSES